MVPSTVEDLTQAMADQDYVLSGGLAVSLFLALRRQRPIFLEGEAGVGKTEVAKTLAALLGRRLIRLQCYEGLDIAAAAYEWNYARQMMQIQAAGQGQLSSSDLFTADNLIERPLLEALRGDGRGAPILLIDELDRADEAFEAYLLEILSDWQLTIPEFGTVAAADPPIVIITSNRTREIHDALKRRCFTIGSIIRRWRTNLRSCAAAPRRRRKRSANRLCGSCRSSATRICSRPWCCRDHRLGAGACRAGLGRHIRWRFDDGRAAEISGRHRAHHRQRSGADPDRGTGGNGSRTG